MKRKKGLKPQINPRYVSKNHQGSIHGSAKTIGSNLMPVYGSIAHLESSR